jgi:hypothetical protein
MIPPDDAEQSQSSLDTEEEPRFGDSDKAIGPLMEKIPEGDAGREIQKKIAKLALKIWESKDKLMEKPEAQWKVNQARRRGISNAKVVFDDLDTHWTAWLPPGASPDVTPDVNKAATLCRRLVSNLFADPPAPEVVPPSGEDDDVAAAEFSERALVDLLGETGTNAVIKARTAVDKASTFGSAYEFFTVDSRGGGKVPVEVQARADATHADNALIDPTTVQAGPDGQPIPGSGTEQGPFGKRYVMPDGTLTDDEQGAATRWAPALKSEVLDGRFVRMIPHTCDDIWDALGVQKVAFIPWGQLKQMAPEITQLPEADKKEMLSYRPKRADDLMPGGERNDVDEKENEDERLVFSLTTHYRQCEEYPEALYLITLADQFVLHRSEWLDPNTKKPLDIPATQYGQFGEGRDGYWKVALMEIVGGGNELRAAQIASWLDHLDHINTRVTFYPTNSILTPDAMNIRSPHKMVPINPGGEPKFEEIPNYPPEGPAFVELISQEMDDAAGLLDTARESSDADSGRQAYAVISQVHAGLSEMRENTMRGYTRGCRIALQLARAFFDVPRQTKWSENGKYRQKAWTGADLTTTTDVRVKPGTMTMLAPVPKAQLAEHYAQLGILPADELREILSSNLGGTIGLQDDPFRQRVRNQLAEWAEGPPEGWQPAPPVPQQDPVTGMVQLVPAPDPAFAQMFEPTPCDALPMVAQTRVTEIARFMAGPKYMKHPREWRTGLDAEYQRMLMAAQPPQPVMPQEPGKAPPKQPAPKPEPLGGLSEESQIPGAPPSMAMA